MVEGQRKETDVVVKLSALLSSGKYLRYACVFWAIVVVENSGVRVNELLVGPFSLALSLLV